MSTTEIRVSTNNRSRLLVLGPISLGFYYYVFGYLPLALWVLGGVTAVVLPFSLFRRDVEGPCIVLNDKGVFDKRLKVGLIRWTDIKRVYSYSLHGVPYVCLDLHDLKKYEARRPVALRFLSNIQRVFGMSPIAISAGSLDLDSGALLHKIQEGCQVAHQK